MNPTLSHPRPSPPRAFTLVEMMVTVSIILILAGLLLSAVTGAREKARTISCLNNHKQIALAWTLYSGDHADHLVLNADSDQYQQSPSWVFGILLLDAVSTNRTLLQHPKVSLLSPYLQTIDVYKCPSDESLHVRSLAMNCRMNPVRHDGNPNWVGGLGTNYVTFRKADDIQHPSNILVTLDERTDSINDAFFAIDMSNTATKGGVGSVQPYRVIDFPANWHSGGMTASFADGHVDRHKWQDIIANPPEGYQARRKPTGPESADGRWLQEHSTYPR